MEHQTPNNVTTMNMSGDNTSMAFVKDIVDLNDFTTAINDKTNRLVVIDFSITRCEPCKIIAPIYYNLSLKYPMIRFYKINSDLPSTKTIVDTCLINAFPTFCFFMDGYYIDRFVGANDKKLEEMIIKYLSLMQINQK